jgi:glycerol-3-phosphate dehydrogenase (NAD(P)+)
MRIGIIGAGSWGTALAWHLARLNHKVLLWCYESEVADFINIHRVNQIYLPKVALPASISATTDERQAVVSSDLIVLAVPTQFLRGVLERISVYLQEKPIVNVAKGIEKETLLLIPDLLKETLPEFFHHCFAYLSGPSFAREVVSGLPTAVCVAADDLILAQLIQRIFASASFRVYTTTDVVGVEIGGALKNVIAIAAGISDGLGLGQNSKAALITRGLYEITKLGLALGAKRETFAGLSGMGDLILTCNSQLSRNRTLGFYIGQGLTLAAAQSRLCGGKMVAEGVATTEAVVKLSQKVKVEMPIGGQVYQVLFEDKLPFVACQELMNRGLKEEMSF